MLEEHYRLVLDNILDHAIFMMDPQGCIVSWNPGVAGVLGYGRDEFIGRDFSIIFTPEDVRQGIPEHQLKTALSEDSASSEGPYVRRDGTRVYCGSVLIPLREQSGELKGFTSVIRDLTGQKRAEQEARELNEGLHEQVTERTARFEDAHAQFVEVERRFATLLATAPAMIYRSVKEPDWPMEFASQYAAELTGYPPEDRAILTAMDFPSDPGPHEMRFYRAVGCEQCGGKGYRGRIGLYEVMVINDEIREMILRGASRIEMERAAEKNGMIRLRDDGLLKAARGMTTVEEVLRVAV